MTDPRVAQRMRFLSCFRESPPRAPPEAVKKFKGRDALLRVRDGKPNTDAEHRVRTGSDLCAQPNFSQLPHPPAPLPRWGEGSRNLARAATRKALRVSRQKLIRGWWKDGDGDVKSPIYSAERTSQFPDG